MLIKVKVWPKSKKEEIVRKSEDSFEIRIKEKPVQGQANRAVVKLLSRYFKISEKRIRLIRGYRKRNKFFEVKVDKN